VDLRHSNNLLLRQLSAADRAHLEPHFTEEPLAFKQPLLEQGKPVERIYFIESGVASIVTDLDQGEAVESGTVGNEGFVGISAVLGGNHSPTRVVCQVPGNARVVAARVIHQEREQGTKWFGLLLRYVHFVTAMVTQTAACNRMHTVDARMSRWLLMTHDRVGADDFPLTQEFMAMMLGVARPTVNVAGATLQRAGFIRYTRGRIAILDRKGLESASCECYERIREELVVTLNGQPPPTRQRFRRAVRKK
jgi:CRP-like cAMP-binding protein